MASVIFSNASASVAPCEQQPGVNSPDQIPGVGDGFEENRSPSPVDHPVIKKDLIQRGKRTTLRGPKDIISLRIGKKGVADCHGDHAGSYAQGGTINHDFDVA